MFYKDIFVITFTLNRFSDFLTVFRPGFWFSLTIDDGGEGRVRISPPRLTDSKKTSQMCFL